MGCFLSLLCGIRESERRSRRRQNDESNAVNTEENIANHEEILVYNPESVNFRPCVRAKGNTKLCRVYLLIYFISDENIENLNFGIPLKRKNFKWRLEKDISLEDLEVKRRTFWETCYSYGVNPKVLK